MEFTVVNMQIYCCIYFTENNSYRNATIEELFVYARKESSGAVQLSLCKKCYNLQTVVLHLLSVSYFASTWLATVTNFWIVST